MDPILLNSALEQDLITWGVWACIRGFTDSNPSPNEFFTVMKT